MILKKSIRKFKDKYTSSIFIRITVIVSCFLVLTVFAGGMVLISLQKKSLLDEKSKSADQLISFVAGLSGQNIHNMSYYALYRNAKNLQGKNSRGIAVISLSVFDNSNKLLNLNAVHPSTITVPRRYWLIKQRDCYYKPSRSQQTRQTGKVVMIFNLQSVYNTVTKLSFIFVFIFISIIVVLDVILLFILRRVVVTPLQQLATVTEKISTGEFISDPGINSSDEIGFLAGKITDMSLELKRSFNKIKRQHNKIKDYSKNLEEKVQIRTAELNDANAVLQQKNEQFIKELEMARRVQQSIIPTDETFPKIDELRFGSKYLSMASVGGDLYDVIRVGRNGYGFLMADVSGHGVPSALITTMAKVSFNSHAGWEKTPAEICQAVNRDINHVLKDLDYYLTAYFGMINLETGEFNYTNAGHHPAVLYRARERQIEKLDSEGMFIGIVNDGGYHYHSTVLEPGDRILLFTDGIIEARNPAGEFYEYDRLNKFIYLNSSLPPADFVEKLVDEVNTFCEGREVDDDRAILYFEFMSKTEKI